MTEILKILWSRPVVFIEMTALSVLANTFVLVTPIFVILVLNRYVSSGVDGTLITLSVGALLAVCFEFLFRRLRYQFADRLTAGQFIEQDKSIHRTLARANYLPILTSNRTTLRSYFGMAETYRNVYSPQNLSLFLDVPFSLVFVLAIYILSPPLAVVVAITIGCAFLIVFLSQFSLRRAIEDDRKIRNVRGQLIDTAITAPSTIRAFDTTSSQGKEWNRAAEVRQGITSYIANRKDRIQGLVRSLTSVLTIAVVGLGATLVTDGKLEIGALIGANILAARALLPIIALSQQIENWAQAKTARASLVALAKIPLVATDGTGIRKPALNIECRELSFTYPHSHTPILDRLGFSIDAGETLCVYGGNGAGKSTLAKVLCNLLRPSAGTVLVDGINLEQISPVWWFNNIVYLPQEPSFINGSIRSNFLSFNPDLKANEIHTLLDRVGLLALVDENPEGLDQIIQGDGRRFSVGVRRRLALARALSRDGAVAILDEPTEGMDPEGSAAVYKVLNELVEKNRTLVVFSHDRTIVRGAHKFLDLGGASN
ncbi:MAG: ATP-binding cassette domain-containing protein [Pseudomonadota bacterium]|nr:ATP-binding cassette domain-containing protein [Pseudomonadota bacterium]